MHKSHRIEKNPGDQTQRHRNSISTNSVFPSFPLSNFQVLMSLQDAGEEGERCMIPNIIRLHRHPPGSHWLAQSSEVIPDRSLMRHPLFLVAWPLHVQLSLFLSCHAWESGNHSAAPLLSYSLGIVAKLFVEDFPLCNTQHLISGTHTAFIPRGRLPQWDHNLGNIEHGLQRGPTNASTVLTSPHPLSLSTMPEKLSLT